MWHRESLKLKGRQIARVATRYVIIEPIWIIQSW